MKDDFIKRMIFENEKDTAFRSSGYFYKTIQEKYHIFSRCYSDVYIKIINYQIKKYGQALDYARDVFISEGAREKSKKVYNTRKYMLRKARD